MQQSMSEVKVAGRVSKDDIAGLLSGKITLGQFLGLSRQTLDQIAEIGYYLLSTGRLAQARQVYEGLVAAQPFDSLYYCHLGAIYQRLNELAGRGEIHLHYGRHQEAIRDLSEAIRLDPQGKRPTSARARTLIEAVGKTDS